MTLKKRRKFKGHDNITKAYRRRFTDYQVMVRAEISRQARLNQRTPGEMACEDILREINVPYQVEKIIQNHDRFVLLDFFIPSANLCIECDGGAHCLQKDYDAGRTKWLQDKGIKTIRFTNKQIIESPETVKAEIKRELNQNTA